MVSSSNYAGHRFYSWLVTYNKEITTYKEIKMMGYYDTVYCVRNLSIGPHSEPILRWAGAMNYGVHSLMYPYFALKVCALKNLRHQL